MGDVKLARQDAGKPLPKAPAHIQQAYKEGKISKKAMQTIQAKEAGYKSYYEWQKVRRTEGVRKTNEGRASVTYREKIAANPPKYGKREGIVLMGGRKVGERYFFNTQKKGNGGLLGFIQGLDDDDQIQIQVKTNRGRIVTYTSKRSAGMLKEEGELLPENLEKFVSEQSPDKKKGKRARKKETVQEVYVLVYK